MTIISFALVAAAVGLAALAALDLKRRPLDQVTAVFASCASSAASITLSVGVMLS